MDLDRYGDVPKCAGDMAIRGSTKEGKLIYSWGDSERGRVEVEATPRKHRAPLADGVSVFKTKAARETTPERALRKMTAKVQRLKARAAKGQHERGKSSGKCGNSGKDGKDGKVGNSGKDGKNDVSVTTLEDDMMMD